MSDLLTVSEVAEILRVDGTTVRRWVKQGALEAVILPHMNERQAYRIKRETVNKILKEVVQQQYAQLIEQEENLQMYKDASQSRISASFARGGYSILQQCNDFFEYQHFL